MLRVVEAEIRKAPEAGNEVELFFDYYATLSRLWMFSMYESIRTHREFWQKSTGEKTPPFQSLLDRLTLVRMPLAKKEIAGTNRKNAPEIFTVPVPTRDDDQPEKYEKAGTPYRPVTGIDSATGSMCWQVIDIKTRESVLVVRQTISDEILKTFS